MTTPLFLLRCLQIGRRLKELDMLTIGMVNDLFIESQNDDFEWDEVGTQEMMDAF